MAYTNSNNSGNYSGHINMYQHQQHQHHHQQPQQHSQQHSQQNNVISPNMRSDNSMNPASFRLSLTRARFNASRSFDLEDDMEFCPILSDEEIKLYQTNDQHLYMRYGAAAASSSTSVNSTSSPSVATKLRILDIVDPATGAKISPILRNASPAASSSAATYNTGRAW